jgi:hypothetical protein
MWLLKVARGVSRLARQRLNLLVEFKQTLSDLIIPIRTFAACTIPRLKLLKQHNLGTQAYAYSGWFILQRRRYVLAE